MASAIIWDNHACMPLRADASFLPQLERHRAAGATVVSLNVGYGPMPWSDHLAVVSFIRRWVSMRPEAYRLVASVADIHGCKADGRLGVLFDVEGMSPVLGHPERVQTFYELGVRWMLIAYNRSNGAGGGCLDPDDGLTPLGRIIVEEMNRVGMVICLSHTGERTAAEAIEYSRSPTIISHSNSFEDNPHPRNVSAGLMRACANRGGVIGLTGVGRFLGPGPDLVASLTCQVAHVADLVGPSHVGLSLDYVFDLDELKQLVESNPAVFAPGADAADRAALGPEAIPEIADGLVRLKFTDSEIRGILGGNWLRVAQEVWK